MATQKLSGTRVPATSNDRPSRLATAPLPELLAEANATIVIAPKRYTDFEGLALTAPSGENQIVLPRGRSARQRDTLARLLVGRLLGTPMAPLPASIEVRTYGGAR
ncbi:hypothetical protein ABZ958_03320 [Streptomyces sp. NPDC046237]|uniref:hypothetical protein n=1 Tax=Streptomyces sp. NPDC046237 TaxID=3154914 RepID=UPI0033C5D6F9